MKRNTASRVAVCLLACCLLFTFSINAKAASPAREALEATVTQVLNELKKPALKNPSTRDQVLKRVEQIVLSLFSFDDLSRTTVGQKWNTFTPKQQADFKEAFTDLLRERYVGALLGYNGETVTYTKESNVQGRDNLKIIETTVNVKDKPVAMNYHMMQKGGKWLVYNIVVEGVGLAQNYRSQFQSVLVNGTPDKLIQAVRDQVAKTRAANNKK